MQKSAKTKTHHGDLSLEVFISREESGLKNIHKKKKSNSTLRKRRKGEAASYSGHPASNAGYYSEYLFHDYQQILLTWSSGRCPVNAELQNTRFHNFGINSDPNMSEELNSNTEDDTRT